MTIRRSFAALVLGLATPLVASTGHAARVDSPTMAKSVRDWHPELFASAPRSAPTIGCTCGRTMTQTAPAPVGRTVAQTATNAGPSDPRRYRGSRSGRRVERAQEIPLRSLRP